jgi:hypothetical protein
VDLEKQEGGREHSDRGQPDRFALTTLFDTLPGKRKYQRQLPVDHQPRNDESPSTGAVSIAHQRGTAGCANARQQAFNSARWVVMVILWHQ